MIIIRYLKQYNWWRNPRCALVNVLDSCCILPCRFILNHNDAICNNERRLL